MAEGDPTGPDRAELILGSYRLVQSLGAGGMSSVFRAVHVESGHEVAVKVLPPTLAKNPTTLQRFLREAKSAEELDHPNIVAIYDRGVDKGRHYLVLEYVAGGDLFDRVKATGPLPIAEAISVARAVAEALRYAAGKGLIHRDIKPANILVSPSGQVKLIDLGLALQAEDEDERVTRAGMTVGTVDFMAPEQARDSRATSVRSDIYSLGCTLYFLLTGQAPFHGGAIIEKLSRHFTEAPPDPKKLRPDVPRSLALLVQKMMAKRPERRPRDYDDLIAALDGVSTDPSASAAPVLTALFDDEEDEAPESGEQPLFALIDDEENELEDQPLFALIDDEDDDAPLPLVPENPQARRDAPRPREDVPPSGGFSMAELAALDDSGRPKVPPRPKSPGRPPSDASLRPGRGDRGGLAPEPGALFEEEAFEGAMPGKVAHLGSRASDDEARKWIIRCVAYGLGIVFAIIAIHQFYRISVGPTSPPEEIAQAPEDAGPPPEPEVVASATPVRPPPPRPAPRPAPKSAVAARPREPSLPPEPTSWAEPTDPVVAEAPEASLGVVDESRFVPDWARREIPAAMPGSTVRVRRVVDPRDPSQKPTLRLAFDVLGGTVVVDDRGPFFEDDLRIFGESRLIRAGAGSRAIVCVEPPQLPIVKRQPAVFVLENKTLVLDGLDLVVDARVLPREQAALFLCKGASLSLRNCTITVINPDASPFSVFRAEGPKASQIRLERTLVRGPSLSSFDLSAGPADVVIGRSVVVGGREALVSTAGSSPGERRVSVVRSLLAAPGPVFEVSGPAPGARPNPLVVRALGSTFARVGDAARGSLIESRDDAGAAADLVSWSGDFNVFRGWGEWMASDAPHVVKVADLASARASWPSTDAGSREEPSPWPVPSGFERLDPRELSALAPESLATLSRVAVPSPYLLEKTVETFRRSAMPKLATVARPSASSWPAPSSPPAATKAAAATPKAAPSPGAPTSPSATVRDLSFDTTASPWRGDLGLFVRDNVRDGDSRVRIWVRGGGPLACSPIRTAEGVSLEVRADPNDPPPTWSPVATAAGGALIEVRGGDLVLSGVRLWEGRNATVEHLVRVDDGHLVLDRCRLTAPGGVGPGRGGLVAFRAAGTRPFERGPGPFEEAPDRPVCLIAESVLITGGDAVTAEIGRGAVWLSQCLVAAGGRAFALRPSPVARGRFDAGLGLVRCTVASERTFVEVDRWPGNPPGPDRPWLVSTDYCAFLASYDRGAQDSVLLRVAPDAMEAGVLAWEAHEDAFDVVHFTARADATPPPARRADLRHQWVELWGEGHMRGVTGPGAAGGLPSVRFLERLKAGGDIQPGDLALDREHHPGRTELDVGADLDRLKIKPTHPPRRR